LTINMGQDACSATLALTLPRVNFLPNPRFPMTIRSKSPLLPFQQSFLQVFHIQFSQTPLARVSLASLLLETKRKQFKKVKAETEILRDTIKTEKPNYINQMEPSQFVLTPEGKTVVNEIKTAIERTRLSMDSVLSWKRFSRGVASEFAESMECAWAKNVKIRFIIESPLESKTAKQLVQFCREKPFCQVKFIRNHPRTVFGIYDKKEIFIIANPKTDLPGSPALWSNNPSLISMAEDYFEMLWLIAMESTNKDPREPKK
jgi:hypothetical protein